MSVEEELELRRMQEDAVNRAREMQRRSHIPQSETEVSSDMPPGMSSETSAGTPANGRGRGRPRKNQTGSASGRGFESSDIRGNANSSSAVSASTPEPTATSAGVSPATPETPSELPFAEIPPEPSEDVLDGLFQDKDRTLILMLLVLISGEDASNELMFALLFLLM